MEVKESEYRWSLSAADNAVSNKNEYNDKSNMRKHGQCNEASHKKRPGAEPVGYPRVQWCVGL